MAMCSVLCGSAENDAAGFGHTSGWLRSMYCYSISKLAPINLNILKYCLQLWVGGGREGSCANCYLPLRDILKIS